MVAEGGFAIEAAPYVGPRLVYSCHQFLFRLSGRLLPRPLPRLLSKSVHGTQLAIHTGSAAFTILLREVLANRGRLRGM